VDVEDFGAKADNKTLSSPAINAAIKKVSASGGGVVHCRSAGSYLVGRIEMQSHVELRISPSSMLQASDKKEHWTPFKYTAPPHCEDSTVTDSTRGGVFRAVEAHDFSITGGGKVDGGGFVWNNDDKRAHFLEFYQCHDVVVKDLTIRNSAAWTLNPKYSQRLVFQRLRIEGDPKGPNHHNTDGFDPWACSDVSFLDSHYDAGDDCIAVKSGSNEQGRKCGIPTENVLVRNITCVASHGLTIGSEMSGGIRNVTFSDIRIGNPDVSSGPSVRIKSQCGRGAYIRDVLYENIQATNVENAVWVDMQYGKGSPPDHCSADLTSVFSNITVRNLRADKVLKSAFEIVGLKIDGMPSTMAPIDLTLENVKVTGFKELGTCVHANVTVRDVTPALKGDDKSCHITKSLPLASLLV
jgi:polygalacturonase